MESTHRLTLLRALSVGIPAFWVAGLICFYIIKFSSGVLVQVLGPTFTYLLAGSVYPLVAAFPLSTLVSTKRPMGFICAFSLLMLTAIVLMAMFLKLVPGMVGGYAAGVLAIWSLGTGISCYIDRRSNVLIIGLSLACWSFLGNVLGHNSRNLLGTLAGWMAYASIYSVFLGSGMGAVLWYLQKPR